MLRAVAVLLCLIALPTHADLTLGLVANRSVEETQRDWQPIADDLAQALGEPVRLIASKDETQLLRRFVAGEIDILRGSSRLALSAVEQGQGEVFARLALTGQVTRYQSLLLVRADGPADLAQLLRKPGQWRYASGYPSSTAGHLIPRYHAFLRNNVVPERFFRSIRSGNAEDNFRALVERRADVAASDSDGWLKLNEKYPRDAKRLRVLWRSPPFSYDPLVLRGTLNAARKDRIARFFIGYGNQGPTATREKEKLYWADQLDRFLPSNNRQLREITDLQLYDALFRLALTPDLGAPQRNAQEKALYRRYDQLVTLLGGVR
ncbi:PhnD/SsuA/transferrin family substrate-binding protein [Chitiniphilus purpureus]|uniref:PhnD/SsuA/transferrin family substrate-binding protein n=1 Tax=Chitiniphilus purpureus TaxID=2981137 RepID=A0ABY6DS49_9NEIS|nr:PhnD/SsuA/transferrin family substrate-binding protein [Chitiniphilus sp. CD1]UXY14728.1 PhnD/SsuA/transferrin family substrate-binding protein [Chitiniphilus sp. CD1]